nr:hypothetical protein [Tanacetum cinerariifolium]
MSPDRQIQNVGGNGRNQFGQYAGQVAQNPQGPRRRDAAYLQTQLLVAQKEEAGIQPQAEEFDFMAAAGDLDEIEKVNANCILMANLQHASISSTQFDKALVYDTDGSAEVQLIDNCYDNEIFNMFTQEEQYTNLLEPIPEPQLVPHNDNHVTYVAPSMVQSGEKSSISSLMEEKKKLKHDFKTQEDKFFDKEVDLEARIKDLENILLKRDQTVQTMHMLNPKPDLFYHPNQKMALGYPNPSYLKKAQLKQQSLYNKVVNYEREISHLKTTYKNLFDSITSNQAHAKLYNLIYENAQLRARVFENTSESMKNTSGTSVTPHIDKPKLSVVTPHSKKLHASIPSHSVTQPREFNVMKRRNAIAPRMFKINPSQTSRENVSSKIVTASSTGLVHTDRTRRPQPKSKLMNVRVPSASKSSECNSSVTFRIFSVAALSFVPLISFLASRPLGRVHVFSFSLFLREGGVTVFGVGKLRSGCAIGLKTTSKVKSGFPGTKVCASGLKHVIVVIVVVPIIDDSLEALNVIYSDVSCTFLVFVVAVL